MLTSDGWTVGLIVLVLFYTIERTSSLPVSQQMDRYVYDKDLDIVRRQYDKKYEISKNEDSATDAVYPNPHTFVVDPMMKTKSINPKQLDAVNTTDNMYKNFIIEAVENLKEEVKEGKVNMAVNSSAFLNFLEDLKNGKIPYDDFNDTFKDVISDMQRKDINLESNKSTESNQLDKLEDLLTLKSRNNNYSLEIKIDTPQDNIDYSKAFDLSSEKKFENLSSSVVKWNITNNLEEMQKKMKTIFSLTENILPKLEEKIPDLQADKFDIFPRLFLKPNRSNDLEEVKKRLQNVLFTNRDSDKTFKKETKTLGPQIQKYENIPQSYIKQNHMKNFRKKRKKLQSLLFRTRISLKRMYTKKRKRSGQQMWHLGVLSQTNVTQNYTNELDKMRQRLRRLLFPKLSLYRMFPKPEEMSGPQIQKPISAVDDYSYYETYILGVEGWNLRFATTKRPKVSGWERQGPLKRQGAFYYKNLMENQINNKSRFETIIERCKLTKTDWGGETLVCDFNSTQTTHRPIIDPQYVITEAYNLTRNVLETLDLYPDIKESRVKRMAKKRKRKELTTIPSPQFVTDTHGVGYLRLTPMTKSLYAMMRRQRLLESIFKRTYGRTLFTRGNITRSRKANYRLLRRFPGNETKVLIKVADPWEIWNWAGMTPPRKDQTFVIKTRNLGRLSKDRNTTKRPYRTPLGAFKMIYGMATFRFRQLTDNLKKFVRSKQGRPTKKLLTSKHIVYQMKPH